MLVGLAVVAGADLLLAVPAVAQTAFVPYYGKNRVRRDKFEWYIYQTDHFDIYYYPELEPHLERMASYAESAYQKISADLKHDLSQRVPLILYKTQSEFQTQNISGGELPEGVLAFAEPERNRMVLPIDEPPDQLYRLITHELTHVFEFDIIPRGLMASGLPLWVDEGLANYMAEYWNVLDLMQVRDAALTDSVPRMSRFESEPLSGRLPYSLGHATFEFIESRWGKDGLRAFLFSLRKSVIGGGESAYEEALKLKPEEFDDQFDRYLKERFKPFRDKERPADYGRDLAPDPERTKYSSVVSIDPAPTGDLLAAVVGNRNDQELDIILISSKDGQIITNLTKGFDKDRGFEYIATSGGLRGNLVPWIAWSPRGDQVAYFARTEKYKTLILQDVVTGKIDQRLEITQVDAPESPSFSPDGRQVAFAGLQEAVADIFTVELATGRLTNLTNDAAADYAPTWAPDGRSLVYTQRLSGNDKLVQLTLGTGEKKQLTFGAHDDTAAHFYDDHTIVFTSTATDPNKPLLDDVARNGNIPNVWSLDLQTNELRQWTDVATGNVSPVVLKSDAGLRVAFVSYYKGRNGIHEMSTDTPVATAQTEDFGDASTTPPPFVPPIAHTLLPDNIHKKGGFEKMTLAARPSVGLGVTSGGDIFGNTQLVFTDVLGDRSISFFAQSVSQYRTTAFTYVNTEGRFQYALQGFWSDQFYYGTSGYLYDPSYAAFIDRDQAIAVSSTRGGTAYGIYPLNRYQRLEVTGGYTHVNERYDDPLLEQAANEYQTNRYGTTAFRRGSMLPVGVTFVQETTIFRDYGPVAGNTVRVAFDVSPGFNDNWLSRRTLDVDARHYLRLGANGVLATRLKGFKSWGRNPDFEYFGGNSEMRGYEYLEFLGQQGFFADAELRFPLIEAMLTPVGVLGGLRGAFFLNVGAAGFNNQGLTLGSTKSTSYSPIIRYDYDEFFNPIPVYGDPVEISGFRLVDARASYGVSLQSFLLGFPMHFDWAWRTLFNKDWEDALFYLNGGSSAFRKVKFKFWIGYDF
ncbi:MAG: hypothetical protein R2752_00425 [Vicinamibacterales bacterium]